MGSCWCKEKTLGFEGSITEVTSGPEDVYGDATNILPGIIAPDYFFHGDKGCPDSHTVDELIRETLGVIGTLVDNEQEPPNSMLKLHNIADNEEGWIQVVTSMVNVIPMTDPLGPSVITLLLDDCPLPSRESVLKVAQLFNLSTESAIKGRETPRRERNICVVLGCIAEKLAGPSSIAILTDGTLNYLLTNLTVDTNPYVILFSLIALEKFAQTSENKATIKRRLQQESPSPLIILEAWREHEHDVKRQVGFCAQWCLDNLFLMEGRKYSYETTDMSGVQAMLNTSDVSEYLKISPDGLEARCDAYSFESVRCTGQAHTGIWYYEVTIITPGVMQIGWATKDSNFLNHEGYGIGDDKFSIAYDGCRRLIWYNARSEAQHLVRWCPGDVLGCLLDLDNLRTMFSVNGHSIWLPPANYVFTKAKTGFFAAASFMSFQQCRFNFGSKPFQFPPNIQFQAFNDHGALTVEEKRVMPRHIFLEELRKHSVREDSCTLCFDKKASVRLVPCDHKGFCTTCAEQLTECPMCRSTFQLVVMDSP